MLNKNIAKMVLPAAALALFAGASQAADVAVNGGFEAGDTSGWASFPTSTSTFTAVNDGSAFEGDWYGNLFNDAPASAAVIKQANVNLGGAGIQPGQEIEISFAARGTTGAGGVAFAEFFSEIDPAGTSKSEILGGGPLALTSDWKVFNFTTTAGPDVSGGVTLQLTATTGGDTASFADIDYDGASISAVPLPAAVWLLGSGILGLVGMSRRRKAA